MFIPNSTNRPLAPGAIIGYRKNGLPIRLIGGGSVDAGIEGGDTSTGQDGASGGTGSSNDGTSGGGGSGGGQPANSGTSNASTSGGGGAADDTPRVIAALRDDYKAERTRRQALEKDLADLKAANAKRDEDTAARNLALAKALGLQVDETPDPEKLAADLKAAEGRIQEQTTRAQARERELSVELAVVRQAAKHGANPELLADSRTFMAKVARLDPSSDSFAEDVGDAIKAAVEANPAYKLAATTSTTTQSGGTGANGSSGQTAGEGGASGGNGSKTTAPPARSGGEHNGAAGGNRQWTLDDVNRLPKTRAGGEALNEAIEAGLLVDLGYAPTRKR